MYPYNWYYFSNNMYSPLMMAMEENYNPETQDEDMMRNNIMQSIDQIEDIMPENVMQSADDPPAIVTNPRPSTALVLRKELTGYPNYGNPSGNADIIYTNTQGVYTFDIPPFLSAAIGRFSRVELIIRGVLDDHYTVPEDRYSMSVNINGNLRNFRPTTFVHGRPAGQRFNNWNQLTIPINAINIRRNNRIVIRNTSNVGLDDWIGLDWIEMRFYL